MGSRASCRGSSRHSSTFRSMTSDRSDGSTSPSTARCATGRMSTSTARWTGLLERRPGADLVQPLGVRELVVDPVIGRCLPAAAPPAGRSVTEKPCLPARSRGRGLDGEVAVTSPHRPLDADRFEATVAQRVSRQVRQRRRVDVEGERRRVGGVGDVVDVARAEGPALVLGEQAPWTPLPAHVCSVRTPSTTRNALVDSAWPRQPVPVPGGQGQQPDLEVACGVEQVPLALLRRRVDERPELGVSREQARRGAAAAAW